MGRVLVVGSMNMDILATMARAPRAGETVNGDRVMLCPGGKGLNQAVAAAQMGAATAFAGRLGRDAFGDEVIAFLQAKGVDTGAIVRSDSRATANALILVDAGGENRIVVIPAANAETTPADAEPLQPGPGDVVACQFESPRSTVAEVFARARRAGARTLLNPAPALDDAPEGLWAQADLLVVNEVELSHFAGVPVTAASTPAEIAAAAARLVSRPDQVVIATLGARGAVAVVDGRPVEVPGRPVAAVDTTGAGDCFVGTLAAGLAAGEPLEPALRRANAAASIAVTRVGTGTAMPTAAEVAAVLAAP
jgi:ribokinase